MRLNPSSSLILASFALATGACAQSPEKPAEWPRHSMERPRPPVVEPQYDGAAVPAPEGALVLFDGTSLEGWKSGAEPAKWQLIEGTPSAMLVIPGSGTLKCELPMEGDGHLHIEWATPSEVKGEGQGRGNSGVFLDGFPEVQVLDSYKNDTYPDGQAAALYGVRPPDANASRSPGEWQAYDIAFERSDADEKTMLLTVTHNGVKVHDRIEINTSVDRRFLSLQDHGDQMRFRNIWFKPKKAE